MLSELPSAELLAQLPPTVASVFSHMQIMSGLAARQVEPNDVDYDVNLSVCSTAVEYLYY